MTLRDIRKRFSELDPLWVDTALAVCITLLICGLVYGINHMRPTDLTRIPNFEQHLADRPPSQSPLLPYVLIVGTFMPLALRRKSPWVALALSGAFAVAYTVTPQPPAPVNLGPMFALYTLAAYSKRRRVGLIALIVVGIVAAVPIFAFGSSVRWVSDVVGAFVLLAAAALLGEAERNRREYIAEVERRAAEAELNRETEALRRVDEERIRIARDVHDIVAHSLSIVTVQAGAAAALLDADEPVRARESIENVRSTGKQALTELRSMLDVLRTGEADAPLAPTADLTHLEALVGPVRDAGIDVSVEVVGELSAVPAFAAVSAYRIVQEALTNVVRHSGASAAKVAVSVTSEKVTLAVTDNGRGASSTSTSTPGHGIQGMRERVEALGGRFSAQAEQDGFAVVAVIPLTRSGS
ncbi:MAG: two-component sensor histidine kinase [Actinobacteria bacterium HGW-Actinobacteria-1]|jgi:signal transduction histidine kinase|nr:MAG: two-component sensor histidine kinase [Actinobacteria bacterium HGW-Actinobacteria-1]